MATQRDGGWDVQEQSLPYHEPVAPVVPKADNTAAEIISRNTPTLVHAILESARQRQENDLATRRMAQDEALRIQGFDVEKRGQDLHYQLGLKDQELAGERLTMEQNHYDDLYDLGEQRNEIYDKQVGQKVSAAKATLDAANRRADLVDQAGKDAEGLGLMDPKFQAEHPMVYAANADGYRQMYEASTDPFIKGSIKKFTGNAEESKVTLKMRDGSKKTYPWTQVTRDFQQFGRESQFYQPLQDTGFLKSIEADTASGQKVPVQYSLTPDFQRFVNDLNDERSKLSKQQSKVDPSTGGLRQPIQQMDLGATPKPASTPTSTKAGQNTAAQANPIPEPEQSSIDKEVEHVKARIEDDPGNAEFYRSTFLKRHPNDGNLLE